MKELNQFLKWADDVSNSYLVEFKEPQPKSLKKLAVLAHPELQDDPDAALDRYLGNKFTDIDRKDAEQTKLINKQSQELNRSMNTINDIRSAYDELERHTKDVEQEIAQIRGGAERTKTGVQQNKLDAQEIKQLQRDIVDIRKNNPKISAEQYDELKSAIAKFKTGVDIKEYEQFKKQIEQLKNKHGVELSQLDRLQQMADQVSAEREEIALAKGNIEQRLRDIENREQNHETEVNKKVDQNTKDLRDKLAREISDRRKTYRTSKQRLDDIEPKVDSLPSEEEMAQLKTLPRRVDDIDSGLEQNNMLDKKQNEVIKTNRDNLEMAIKNSMKSDFEIEKIIKPWISRISRLAHKEKGSKNSFTLDKKFNDDEVNAINDKFNNINNLSESFEEQINTMIENILGEQLGIYLK